VNTQVLSTAFEEMQSWVTTNKLLLHQLNTRILLLGSPQQLQKLRWLKLLLLG